VKLPVILCANKADLAPDVEAEEEMMPIMAEFKVGIGLFQLIQKKMNTKESIGN
jgi:hypothetical protein